METTALNTMDPNQFDANQFVNNVQNGDPISIALLIVSGLIIIVSIFAFFVSIILSIKYVKYNKQMNSANLSGEQAARKILDANDLQDIKVKVTGSLMFGNSYSHYFKKVRLRRRTVKKPSIASLAMAAQKSSLAVLDKEGDPDMKKRVKLTILNVLGPLAFIPLVIIGIALDIVINNTVGNLAIIFAGVGFLFYLVSFLFSIAVLKTEKKAQEKAVEILLAEHMATPDEVEDMKKLFKLYNIEYVNNLILSMLEMLYYVLRIIAMFQGKGNSSSKK